MVGENQRVAQLLSWAILAARPRVARHEAAHAVIAHALGGTVVEVTISPGTNERGERSDGRCRWEYGGGSTLRQRAIVALAGEIASGAGGRGDAEEVRRLADAVIEEWRADAQDLVERHREQIGAVATSLLAHGTLGENAVRAVLAIEAADSREGKAS